MDNGFIFDGRHSLRDYGVIAIRAQGRTLAAPGEVVSYQIGGMQGTMAYADAQELKEYTQTVRLYADRELGSETAATALWRELVAWLTCGRRKLIWDSEPDKYILAEAVEICGDTTGWIEEGLKVTMKCQPVLRSVDTVQAETTIMDGSAYTLWMTVRGLPETPVCAEVTVTGTRKVTGCEIVCGGRRVKLDGFGMLNGDRLVIDMEAPSGAKILHRAGGEENAMPHCLAFDHLTGSGDVEAVATITFADGSGERGARVKIYAREAWR